MKITNKNKYSLKVGDIVIDRNGYVNRIDSEYSEFQHDYFTSEMEYSDNDEYIELEHRSGLTDVYDLIGGEVI